jgi:antitoxin PrlF
MESALSIKGQITIPKEIREHLNVRPGDRVKFFINPNGTVVMMPRLPASRLKGIVRPRKGGPVSLEEVDAAIAAGAASRAHVRTRR